GPRVRGLPLPRAVRCSSYTTVFRSRLLVLPLAASAADSAGSIALSDAVRDRLTALTKNKVLVVPKAKLCEALAASGFPWERLLDDQQARQLGPALQAPEHAPRR